MDYDKLICQLRDFKVKIDDEKLTPLVCLDAATAIETLWADLARVTAERDALIKRTAGDCWSCVRRYECNSRKGPHRRCWEFDPWLLKED